MTVWCGAIMSACGFTWVYIALLAILAQSFQWLPARYIEGIFSLGYLVIIVPLLGSGLGITASSWAHFGVKRICSTVESLLGIRMHRSQI